MSTRSAKTIAAGAPKDGASLAYSAAPAPLDAETRDAFLAEIYASLPAEIECAPRRRHAERRKMLKPAAVRFAEIVPDPKGRVIAVRVDVDSQDGATSWQSTALRGLPPNVVVASPVTGRAHLWWLLDFPVTLANPNSAGFLRDVERAAASAVPGGDLGFTNRDFTHSPWTSDYDVTVWATRRYSLAELRAALPTQRQANRPFGPRRRSRLDDIAESGRNGYVFAGMFSEGALWLRRGRALDSSFAADLYARGRELTDEARLRFASVEPYAARELVDSHRSVLRYLRRKSARIVVRHPALIRAYERDRKRARRGSVRREEYVERANARREEIARLSRQGMGATAIAETLGISRSEVYRLQRVTTPLAVSGCPAATGGSPQRDSLSSEAGRVRAREVTKLATTQLESLLLPREKRTDFAWLIDERGDTCGIGGRLLLIRDALLALSGPAAGLAEASTPPFTAEAPGSVGVQFATPRGANSGRRAILAGSFVKNGSSVAADRAFSTSRSLCDADELGRKHQRDRLSDKRRGPSVSLPYALTEPGALTEPRAGQPRGNSGVDSALAMRRRLHNRQVREIAKCPEKLRGAA